MEASEPRPSFSQEVKRLCTPSWRICFFLLVCPQVWQRLMLDSIDGYAPLTLVAYYGLQGLTALAVALLCLVRRRYPFSNSTVQIVLLVLTVAAPFLALFGSDLAIPSLCLLGAACGGIGLAWSYILCMDALRRTSLSSALVYILLSMVAAALIRMPLEFSNSSSLLLLAAPLPVVCFLAWRKIRSEVDAPQSAQSGESQKAGFTAALLLMLVAYGFALGLIRVPADFNNGELIAPSIYLLFKLALPVFLLILLRKDRWLASIEWVWQGALLLVLSALLIIYLLLGEATTITAAASTSARTTVNVLLWVALIGYALTGPFDLVYYYALCWGVYMVANAIGVYLGDQLQLDPRNVVLGLVYLLVMFTLAALAVIKRRRSKFSGGGLPTQKMAMCLNGVLMKLVLNTA